MKALLNWLKSDDVLTMLILTCALTLLVCGSILKYTNDKATVSSVETKAMPSLAYLSEARVEPVSAVKSEANKVDVIILQEANTVVFAEAFSDSSVTTLMVELQEKSEKLAPTTVIYLVLDSPGGSIQAGNRLISFIKALPQPVKTITLFSASMAFHTVQNLDERLILDSGTLMSHRASFSGFSGEVPGEFLVRLNYWLQILERMDNVASSRMDMTINDYRELTRDEYWVEGHKAVSDNAADRVVGVRCGRSMGGTRTIEVNTMFGLFRVVVSKCPLMPGILSVARASTDEAANKYVETMFLDKRAFFNEYVKTNAWVQFQK